MLTWASVSGNTVDPLPDEVGVAVVARVLLDHVQVDPADVPGALRMVTVAGHDIIKLLSGHGGAYVFYFLLEGLDVGGRVRVIKRFEVLAGLVWVVREGHVDVRRVHAEPPALHLGHMPHQAKQGQPRRRNRPLLQLASGQAGALMQQRFAMEVQPSLKSLALTQDEPRVGALHPRSRPCFGHNRHGSCARLSPSITYQRGRTPVSAGQRAGGWTRWVQGIVPARLAAISVRSAGSQARTVPAWVNAIRAVMAAGLGAATCGWSSSVTIMTSNRP